MIAQYVLDHFLADLDAREPRALELAFALTLTLPQTVLETQIVPSADATKLIGADARDLMEFARERYDALRDGTFAQVELGNPYIWAFERVDADERLLIVNNLARVPQPVKFMAYTGRAGWDILNRIEFLFPARVQLEEYEFLWLMLTD